jgi:ankyrin repeat protein
MMAATVGRADMVAVLLNAGADMDVASRGGETAMSIAQRRNKQTVVSLLLEAGKTETPLTLRAKETL